MLLADGRRRKLPLGWTTCIIWSIKNVTFRKAQYRIKRGDSYDGAQRRLRQRSADREGHKSQCGRASSAVLVQIRDGQTTADLLLPGPPCFSSSSSGFVLLC